MKVDRSLLIVCIVSLCVGFFAWRILLKRDTAAGDKEGFQTAGATATAAAQPPINTVADTASEFWSIVNAANDYSTTDYIGTLEIIKRVSDPAPDDPFQVTFPKYISAYALAKYKRDPIPARAALLSQYDTLMRELTLTVYDQNKVTAWNTDPKTQSCVALNVLQTNLAAAAAEVKAKIQGVQTSATTLGSMRDENLAFQQKYLAACSTKPISQACIDLASQEPILFPLLSEYDALNVDIYAKEVDIQESIKAVQDIYGLVGCTGGATSFDADRDIGTVDTEALRAKLETLSPYYISPDTLQYITRILISPEEVSDAAVTNNALYKDIQNTVTQIKAITGTPDRVSAEKVLDTTIVDYTIAKDTLRPV